MGKIIGGLFRLIGKGLWILVAFIFVLIGRFLMTFLENFVGTPAAKKRQRQRENDELRKLRLKRARERDYY
ncbi:hypothetical protein [Neorhizobium sp. IRS_2294]|uniref:hypothetical protein n=1 Tax=unclassified Neorhizobium TaxID=2629175 RepID=UPI003D27A0C7